ncbi:hypothetical protein [endosymbiont GvMRE of Glomus versiforme]|uniref:hypothetical protein n=1 Tax=endosymbiont GvMRE of Glomus versiforme TaxID=2039283 RepID=UPI000ECF9A1E|nr:hypothetical protein [endosymbiont GvMRE of Glomus versiforme]RHZ36418.1 hypothetical protein GvMRE_Ic1g117 [endosymbiont GvMRE of Glomus versiforme]
MTKQFNLDIDTEEIKQKLGEQTQKLEQKAGELWDNFTPHYTNLEPWQRGLILIGILALLVFVIYYLTKQEDPTEVLRRKERVEAAMEERVLKRVELLKKLRE